MTTCYSEATLNHYGPVPDGIEYYTTTVHTPELADNINKLKANTSSLGIDYPGYMFHSLSR